VAGSIREDVEDANGDAAGSVKGRGNFLRVQVVRGVDEEIVVAGEQVPAVLEEAVAGGKACANRVSEAAAVVGDDHGDEAVSRAVVAGEGAQLVGATSVGANLNHAAFAGVEVVEGRLGGESTLYGCGGVMVDAAGPEEDAHTKLVTDIVHVGGRRAPAKGRYGERLRREAGGRLDKHRLMFRDFRFHGKL